MVKVVNPTKTQLAIYQEQISVLYIYNNTQCTSNGFDMSDLSNVQE